MTSRLESLGVRRLVSIGAAGALLLSSSSALATFSVLAVDLDDASVGGAVASCVALDTTLQVYEAVPGKGAVMTQSYLLPRAHADALSWIAAGEPPGAIIEALTDEAYDADFRLRQYAVVSPAGGVATFSGTGANPFAGHLAFEVRETAGGPRRFVVSAQGNFLTGEDVLERARKGFEAPACDLPERLLNALVAAGSTGGDARCAPRGTPAESALLAVDPPALPRGNYLRLTSQVSAPATQDPLLGLQTQFASWREAHPCPQPTGEVGGSSGDAGEASRASQDGCRLGAPGSGSQGEAPWLGLALAGLGVGLGRRYAAPHPRNTERRTRR